MTNESGAPARIIDIALRLGLLAVLILACLRIIQPFVGVLLWSVLLAVMLAPVHRWLIGKGLANSRSATLIGVGGVAVLAVPAALVASSLIGSIADIVAAHHNGPIAIPPPPAGLADWPLIGAKAVALWTQAQSDLPALLQSNADTVKSVVLWLAGQAGGIAATLGVFIGALALAAVLLAYGERLAPQVRSIFVRVTGDAARGERLLLLSAATVRGVLQGVVGVALIQALLLGIGFFAGGVPFAGALTLAVLLFGILQLPALLFSLPAIAWAWSHLGSTAAAVFTVWMLVAGLADNVLKPLMLGRGLEVPMPVILVGVIGGMLADGLVGLFVGPVLLGVGYVLFNDWLAQAPE
ncbi:MAG: AI-2E family transporter [Alphaproteobacteria bacterium PA4]|nr:MAG: AI-2E family transporter [Alphaproteobacteria bacterium PA4]